MQRSIFGSIGSPNSRVIAVGAILIIAVAAFALIGLQSTVDYSIVSYPNQMDAVPDYSQLPPFIERVYPMPGNTALAMRMICLTINTPLIWEAGDTFEGVKRQVRDTLQIQVDGTVIPHIPADLYTIGSFETSMPGNVVQSPVSTCVEAPLTVGTHSVAASFNSTSDKAYQSSWSFGAKNVAVVSEGNKQTGDMVAAYYAITDNVSLDSSIAG